MGADCQKRRGAAAFTLVEVIVALGILAATVTSLVTLLAAGSRAAADLAARTRAAHLDGAVVLELERLRDAASAENESTRLDALANLIAAGDSAGGPLRLVASRAGLVAVRESAVDRAALAIPPGERFYLVEVRLASGGLAHKPGDGSVVVTATVRWPYTSGASSLPGEQFRLNLAIGP